MPRRAVSRRGLLRAGLISGVTAASAALPLAAVHGSELTPAAPTDPHQLHQNQQPATTPLGGFTFFTPFQAEIVNAAAGRIIPADANGPGAIEAGVVFFIDRQLSASYNFIGRRYVDGPFTSGTATQRSEE